MRVLLDEDIPIRLRHYFQREVDVETVEFRGWKGLKNGALLTETAFPEKGARHHLVKLQL